MSSNIVKGSFIRFSGENTRVIDSQDLVKKRMDDFSGVLRERSNPAPELRSMPDGTGITDEALGALVGDNDGGFKEISFAEHAQHIETEEVSESFNDNSAYEDMTLNAEEVRAECDAMIAKANQKAEEIREAAQEEAERIKAEAKEQGYNIGIEEGRTAGLEEYNEAMAALEAERANIYAQYDNMLSELEPKMVDAIVAIYRHVFGAGIYSRQDVIVHLLNRALTSVSADEGIFIFVSPKDYDEILEQKEAVISKTALREVPDIRVRDDLSEGQAIIETPYGILDCSIDTELSELEKTLKMLSFERRG